MLNTCNLIQNSTFDIKFSPASSSVWPRKVESKQIILGDTREDQKVSGELRNDHRWRAAVWATFVSFLLRTSILVVTVRVRPCQKEHLDSSETRITSACCQKPLHAPRYTTFNLTSTITRHVLEESMKVQKFSSLLSLLVCKYFIIFADKWQGSNGPVVKQHRQTSWVEDRFN